MSGWSRIKDSFEDAIIPVVVSPEARILRSDIRDYANHDICLTSRSKGSLGLASKERERGHASGGIFQEGRIYSSNYRGSHGSWSRGKMGKKLDK